ncbi:MAG: hypothetical protein MZW92_13795 [Comamonadaceae bacterium]|nr:hypothetical protein [Comamonadaceae bacterium]
MTALGTAGTGPASFRVERRDGLIYEYGGDGRLARRVVLRQHHAAARGR